MDHKAKAIKKESIISLEPSHLVALGNEGIVIDVNDGSAKKHAVTSIGDSSMARDEAAKVLKAMGEERLFHKSVRCKGGELLTFLLHPLLNPDARKPPKGPTRLQTREMTTPWVNTKGHVRRESRPPSRTNWRWLKSGSSRHSSRSTSRSDVLPRRKSTGSLATTGQRSEGQVHSTWQSAMPSSTVSNPPPKKPSRVFLGLSCNGMI